VANTRTQTANLVYDAASEVLSGTVPGEHPFHLIAYSGGSRGHTAGVQSELAKEYLHSQAATLSSHFANTPRLLNARGKYIRRGGTLPAGHYICRYVANHPGLRECIQLLRRPDATAIHTPFYPHPLPHGRTDDFFIHGSGPKGSDGCIVPALESERRRLNSAVKNFAGAVILEVRNVSYSLPPALEHQIA
jgi:hypothetical protein